MTTSISTPGALRETLALIAHDLPLRPMVAGLGSAALVGLLAWANSALALAWHHRRAGPRRRGALASAVAALALGTIASVGLVDLQGLGDDGLFAGQSLVVHAGAPAHGPGRRHAAERTNGCVCRSRLAFAAAGSRRLAAWCRYLRIAGPQDVGRFASTPLVPVAERGLY